MTTAEWSEDNWTGGDLAVEHNGRVVRAPFVRVPTTHTYQEISFGADHRDATGPLVRVKASSQRNGGLRVVAEAANIDSSRTKGYPITVEIVDSEISFPPAPGQLEAYNTTLVCAGNAALSGILTLVQGLNSRPSTP